MTPVYQKPLLSTGMSMIYDATWLLTRGSFALGGTMAFLAALPATMKEGAIFGADGGTSACPSYVVRAGTRRKNIESPQQGAVLLQLKTSENETGGLRSKHAIESHDAKCHEARQETTVSRRMTNRPSEHCVVRKKSEYTNKKLGVAQGRLSHLKNAVPCFNRCT